MDSIRVSEAPDSGSIPDEATKFLSARGNSQSSADKCNAASCLAPIQKKERNAFPILKIIVS